MPNEQNDCNKPPERRLSDENSQNFSLFLYKNIDCNSSLEPSQSDSSKRGHNITVMIEN